MFWAWLRKLCGGISIAMLGACASGPHGGLPPSEDSMRDDSSRYVVLAVANPLEGISSRAGSSLTAYSAPPRYTVGTRAAQLVAELVREYGLREATGWPIPSLGWHCVVLEIAPHTVRSDLIARLQQDKRVQLVQALQSFETYTEANSGATYNDPYVDLQRGFKESRAAQAHLSSVGKDVRIAVIDTGAYLQHPDLEGRIDTSRNMVGNTPFNTRQEQHGTEVLGVIGAKANNGRGIVGMAPEARLSLYQACWYRADQPGAQCNSFTLAKALAAVLQSDAKIINLSLGGPDDALLTQLTGQLIKQGRIVVGAVPQSQQPGGFPSGVPGVTVVGVTGTALMASSVVRAPGRDILTLQPGGHYDFASGSSIAAAHVTGLLALLWAYAPDLDRGAILDALQRSSTPQIDAERALQLLRTR
jgi:hypothetical protein